RPAQPGRSDGRHQLRAGRDRGGLHRWRGRPGRRRQGGRRDHRWPHHERHQQRHVPHGRAERTRHADQGSGSAARRRLRRLGQAPRRNLTVRPRIRTMTASPGDGRASARPGLRDVAKLAGVSHQTVSRVFKDHPRVSPETRARVLAAAAQLDFRPNAAARTLATGRSHTLGVVSFDATMFGPASMITEIERCARESDYFTSVVTLQSASERTISEAAERLRGQGVDGLIVIPGHVPLVQTTKYLPQDLPIVVMESETIVPAVGVDQYTGPKAATRYLL